MHLGVEHYNKLFETILSLIFFGKMSKKVSDFVTFLSISQLSDVRSSKFESLRKGEIKAFPTVCVIFRKNEYYKRYKPSRARLRRARDGFFFLSEQHKS